jgi:hypothetical protein
MMVRRNIRHSTHSYSRKLLRTLLAERETFVKGFTEKLLCYALGRPIGYGDHLTVEQVIAQAAKSDYRLQEIIQATVTSEFFQTK